MHTRNNKRQDIWQDISNTPKWDIIVIGGGITGAGILREAVRAGAKTLLIEQRDFAWGTSSRSSKMVHGGLRYLKQGQIGLMRQSVQERQHLLQSGPGLIDPLGFLMPTYEGDGSKLLYQAGLSVYDMMALQWGHQQYKASDFELLAPHIAKEGLEGGFRFGDAQTDDARLVLRVISEAVADGGTALNYVKGVELIKEDERVTGVVIEDVENGQQQQVFAEVVINATGAWADELRNQNKSQTRIRPLRGSHLIFPQWRFPVAQAVSFFHPLDRRPVFAFPWEGVTLVGTTDLDHETPLDQEPHISGEEVAYLLAAVNQQFPTLSLSTDDVIATYSGVRPVIGTGKADPSKESRDHVIWKEDGLLTVTGGKLTTFRIIALDTLKSICEQVPALSALNHTTPALDRIDTSLPPKADRLSTEQRQRLLGRYGHHCADLINLAHDGELNPIAGTKTLWAELRWASKNESVCHLDDLLLRRTRIGLLLRDGGLLHVSRIRSICQAELGWSDVKWQEEVEHYQALWQKCYSLPPTTSIPDWKAYLPPIPQETTEDSPQPYGHTQTPRIVTFVALMVIFLGLWGLIRRRN